MPSPRNFRKGGEEKKSKGRLKERASSFHGQKMGSVGDSLRRPRTFPDLLAGTSTGAGAGASPDVQNFLEHSSQQKKLSKLLLNVTIQRSLGAVMVVMSPESTVKDLITAAVIQYVKEGRRPILPSTDPAGFDLHYSQFSLESLQREEKLVALGSRNFFLYPRKCGGTESSGGDSGGVTAASCSKEVEKAKKIALPWLQFMDFLL